MVLNRTMPLIAVALTIAAISAGCLQVEVNIQMHDDGSATITERVRFSRQLMELDGELPADQQLLRFLERASIDQRMKEMGNGVALVSHKVETLADGSRESLAEFKIGEIDDLRLVNPYLAQDDPNRLMRLQFSPIYRVVHSFHRLGDLMLALTPAEKPTRRGPTSQPEETPPPTPRQLQMLRLLQPTFADMMEGVQIKCRLTATRPITFGQIRDRQANSKTIELISFTSDDLDAYGVNFMENEELMLDLMRLQFDSQNIADHVKGFPGNHTVPVFRSPKNYGSGMFRVPPSTHQFKKYFAGRPKSQGGDQPG